jgi:hypothetical protein
MYNNNSENMKLKELSVLIAYHYRIFSTSLKDIFNITCCLMAAENKMKLKKL